MSKTIDGAVPEFFYLNLKPLKLSGRGGAVRFYFLRNGIKFNEQLVELGDWGKQVKGEVKATSNPSAHVPVVTLNGQKFTEHHAILRYLERVQGAYGKDALHDYRVDRVASASQEWRDSLIASLLEPDTKEKYAAKREDFYEMFSRFIESTSGAGPHVVGSTPSFADDVLFGILLDDTSKYGSDTMGKYPTIQRFFDAYRKVPAVDAWCTALQS